MRRLLSGPVAAMRCRPPVPVSCRSPAFARHLSGERAPPCTSVASSKRPIKTSCANKFDSGTEFRIVKDERTHLRLDGATLAGSNVLLDDLEFSLSARGRPLSLNLTWLRDSCHCHLCTHKHSRQRLFTPKDFERRQFEVDEVAIRDDLPESQAPGPKGVRAPSREQGVLQVKWADGHESRYSLSWLCSLDALYTQPKLEDIKTSTTSTSSSPAADVQFSLPRDDFYAPFRVHTDGACQQVAWNVAEIQDVMRPVDYGNLIDGFQFHDDEPTFINSNDIEAMSSKRREAISALIEQLAKFGLAKIVNVPETRNQVLRVARSLAYERPTGYGTVFDVVVEPSEEINLAYSSQEFDLHSDLTYREMSPGVQLLHCIKNSDEGGVSYFSDTLKAALELEASSPLLFQVLLRFPAVFTATDPYRSVCFRRQKPVLSLDYRGQLKEAYYSPFMLPPVGHKEDLKLFYLALDKFTQILQSKENKLMTKMDPGDLFIFHNRRVLHGRSSYDPSKGNRFLQGCYMDWDEIGCLYEKLATNK